MAVDLGNAELSAIGFFNPMLGAGDAVTVGGGGAGGMGAFAFDIDGDKVVRCGLMFGRRWVECDDTSLGVLGDGKSPTGCIYATVSHDGTDVQLTVHSGSELPENGVDVSHRLLYKAEKSGNGNQYWADYRSCITIMAMD